MNILTDIELEQRAADGESEAFGVLYERYSPRVYDFLLRMVREPAEAADLTQETFVRAMRSMKAERAGKAEFSTWLFTIARNLALTRLERSKRTEPLADEGEDDSAYYRFDPDRLDNPEAIAQASEIASLVWEASEALEPKQRTLLELHVRQGLDSAEIATVLGISKGSAYTMVSRLKDTFESAVAGLVMFRAGRRNCLELNQLLEDNGATQLSPDVRKLIERHTQSCNTCQGRRRELVSAAAILRALVPMPLMPGLASRIRDGAWTQAQQAGPAGAASGGASGAAGGGHGGGLLSMPARALQALPGPAWLAAVAALVVAAVAVPVALLTMRSGGGASNSASEVATALTGGTPIASSDATSTGAAVVAAAAAGASFDGAYTIALAPGDDACGVPSIQGLSLAIQGDMVTLSSPTGELLRGSAAPAGGHLSVQLGAAQGRAWGVNLSGYLDDAGNIRGQSKSGGVNPGGQTGFSCNLPFTAYATAARSLTVPGCPDATALRAAWLASPAGAAAPGNVIGFGCWSTWAVAFLGSHRGSVLFSTSPGLHVASSLERTAFQAAICSSGAAPTRWTENSNVVTCAAAAGSTPPVTPATTAVASALSTDTDRLREAIAAQDPGIGFDPECVPAGTQTCATGSWSDAMLATGIAGVSVHNAQEGVGTFYGRKADGTWVFWFGTQNSGGPQVQLPGDMIVCAQGDGLNLRAAPSTSAAVVTLIPDGTVVRGDRFVMTDPPSPGVASPQGTHPDGWYHITSPQEGWAYDRFLLGPSNGVTTCIKTWWP